MGGTSLRAAKPEKGTKPMDNHDHTDARLVLYILIVFACFIVAAPLAVVSLLLF
jgi:hypothetical protein